MIYWFIKKVEKHYKFYNETHMFVFLKLVYELRNYRSP